MTVSIDCYLKAFTICATNRTKNNARNGKRLGREIVAQQCMTLSLFASVSGLSTTMIAVF